jgi:hypothetical protein
MFAEEVMFLIDERQIFMLHLLLLYYEKKQVTITGQTFLNTSTCTQLERQIVF